MRYLLGLICVLALGVMGCSESPPPPPPPECEADADCDDGNECTWERCDSWDDSCYRVDLNQAPCDFDGLAGWCIDGVCSEDLCAGVVCDDGNECTRGECRFPDGSCEHRQLTYISGCDFDGLAGWCIDGVCSEDLCAGDPCDDGNECTRDRCNFPDGLCERWNERGDLCDFDGLAGRCKDGGCHEDLCPGVVCDDGNLCTDDYCDWFTGTCRVHERYCPINDGVCLLFTCDPADGSCVRTTEVAPDGTRCGMWEECQNGECVCTSLWCG